jgi:3,4-dihydroxy-2-butanone 4-phosphate synthase
MLLRLGLALIVTLFAVSAQAATLTVQTTDNDGLAATYAAAAAGGDKCANDGRTYIEVKNSSGANAYTVTVDATQTFYGTTVTDQAITIPASATAVIKAGPWNTNVFSDSGGFVNWTYTGTAPATDITVACIKLPATQ